MCGKCTSNGACPGPCLFVLVDQDCRSVEELVKETFSPDDAPTAVVIDVGDKPTWKDPKNQYRRQYGIDCMYSIL